MGERGVYGTSPGPDRILGAGTTLGRYEIEGLLGQGGMAVVYRAKEPGLGRTVALKVIRPAFAEDPGFAERFRREARAIAKLSHPNIVTVFRFDEIEGRLVLAMQFLDGGTLKDRTAAGQRLSRDEIAGIVAEVAGALGHAHDEGIVHRDVKPSNVMLVGGRAIVTDFGIAKVLGATSQTQTGVGIGTPDYMSPEQGQGRPVDRRADIYSLAVVAYELLTGRVPFVADTPMAVIFAHVRDPLPSPRSLDPTIPAAAERVLQKALAKDPADRYETAPEFAAALIDALATSESPSIDRTALTLLPTPRRRSFVRRRPALLAGVGAVALLVVSGVAAAVTGTFSPARATAAAVPTAPPGAQVVRPVPSTPTPTPVRITAPPTLPPWNPTAVTPPTVPARGALLWQAKLDGTGADLRNTRQIQPAPKAGEFHYLTSAIEMALTSDQGGNLFGDANLPLTLTNYVGEIDVSFDPATASAMSFRWTIRRTTGPTTPYPQLWIRVRSAGLDVVIENASSSEALVQPVPVPDLVLGRVFTLGMRAVGQTYTIYVDGGQVADITEPRVISSITTSPTIQATANQAGAIRVLGWRYYSLP